MVGNDSYRMRHALQLAAQGRGLTSPNPMVGAVVVASDGSIVGNGYHRWAGEDHAEVIALSAAGYKASGATLYCTLEPCCHYGRTGPCVKRIIETGIARVVVAMLDPNPEVNGGGVTYLRHHGISVDVGVCCDEAMRLNAAFVTWISCGRPFVTMKVAASLDGCIARRVGERTALTSNESDTAVHELRSEVDGIGVGSTTLMTDDPLLTVRGVERARPLVRVVFDRRIRTRPTARVFDTLDKGPVFVLTTEREFERRQDFARALTDVGAEVEVLPGEGTMEDALEWLGARKLTSLVIEGGRLVHEALWSSSLVDRVQVFVAPIYLGKHGVRWLDRKSIFRTLTSFRVRSYGPDLLMEGDVYRTR